MAFGKAIQVIKALLGSFFGHMFYKICNERTSLITILVSQNRIVLLWTKFHEIVTKSLSQFYKSLLIVHYLGKILAPV